MCKPGSNTLGEILRQKEEQRSIRDQTEEEHDCKTSNGDEKNGI